MTKIIQKIKSRIFWYRMNRRMKRMDPDGKMEKIVILLSESNKMLENEIFKT